MCACCCLWLLLTDYVVVQCGRPSDVWSLGCILYQLAFGKTPMQEKNMMAKIAALSSPNLKIPIPPHDNAALRDVLEKLRPPLASPSAQVPR